MANFADANAALDDYRSALLEARQSENVEFTASAFSARGAYSAFATPLSNVHATGVGVRIRGGQILPEDFVIKVYVFDKQVLGDRTPALTQDAFEGIGIDVEQLPVQQALAQATTPAQHQARRRPVVGGLQISPRGMNYVGTLGCMVRAVAGNPAQIYALSNNHVLANTNMLALGTPIAQPFGDKPADLFARLSQFVPILFPTAGNAPRNRMDAALAAISDPSLVQLGKIFGVPGYTPGLLAPRPAMPVIKSGRTTGVTRGMITAVRVNGVTVNYGTNQSPQIATFDNCVQIVGGAGQSFSLPGDSGSVILDAKSGKAVALLFAGNGSSTTACDLGAVCARFGVVPV